jgi:adenine deaminase
VVVDGKVACHLPLPICGLMSERPAVSLAQQIDELKAACLQCGVTLAEPFIQMAFLSLPVIPSLKLTSKGLFDGDAFRFTTLSIEN